MDVQKNHCSHARSGWCRAWFLAALPILPGPFYSICRHYSGNRHPTYRDLVESKRIAKGWRGVAVYILLFALLTGFLLLLFPLVFEQGSAIVKDIPNYYQELRTWVEHSPNLLIKSINHYLPDVTSRIRNCHSNRPRNVRFC